MFSEDDPIPPGDAQSANADETGLLPSGLGSGLLARQPTPAADAAITVAKVCPQCGTEYETGDRFCPKDGTALRPKAAGDPLVGRVIADRYLVLARLGEGGMGRVYVAEHVKMNRQCAIKVMNPSLMTDTESLQRFAREASSAARILHPNVAAVFDYGDADKIVYLVMEYVDGEPLSTIIARDRILEPRRAIELARGIADGLHAAHELGIVHRDLKPDNVIVARTKSGKEVPKVVDFGIAKALTDAQEDALTRSGLVIGTPEYMSPEQLLGDPVDPRADIYSLGCILYQMLTGEQAFAAESREQMIRRRLHEPPPHVRDILPDLPRRLDTLIVHMLARSPGDRLANAAEARDALDPALALGGWDPGLVSTKRPITAVGAPAVADPSLQPTMPMPKARATPKRLALGAVIAAAALFAGVGLWSMAHPAAKAGPNRIAPQATDTQVSTMAAAPVTPDSTKPDAAKRLPPLSARAPAQAAADSKPKAAAVNESVPDRATRTAFAPVITAIKNRDVNGLKLIPSNQLPSFQDMWTRATSVRVTVDYGSLQFDQAEGTAERNIDLHVKTQDQTGAPMTLTFPYRAHFRKKHEGTAWELVALVPQK
ncbi:MAG TPA: serine/threonine-protein kinase [Gemmatimonadaceae bacterium]|jgi:serine/threonine-protein kinase|nr:serine/threonine-protein kinase [Gemmatimonadaceae bacterium]